MHSIIAMHATSIRLHPSQAFEQPVAVNDPDLSLNEKRAILASWASDACAVEAVPALRRPPGGKRLRYALSTNKRGRTPGPERRARAGGAGQSEGGLPMRGKDVRLPVIRLQPPAGGVSSYANGASAAGLCPAVAGHRRRQAPLGGRRAE
jgi:hypothetical protein